MAQFTWRVVLIGACLGGVLSLTNLYIGLKAGWGFGVAITASILSYAIWTSLLKAGLARTPMTILGRPGCASPRATKTESRQRVHLAGGFGSGGGRFC
jgi:hypothetical protein